MTEPPSEHRKDDRDLVPPPGLMPRWVPVVIGLVLVSLAALAVITGLRYRDQTFVKMIKPRRTVQRPTAPAPSGEPEPGASLVLSGDSGSNVPIASEITSGVGVPRVWARRGMKILCTPGDAVVYVNDVPLGQARQFDSDDEIYDFADTGNYTVRLVAPGYKERQFVVTASEDAKADVAIIQAKLVRE